MIKEKVGEVTEQERNEISALYARKTSLHELLLTLGNKNFEEESYGNLYEKVVLDLTKTKIEFDQWWKEKSQKYNWKSMDNGNWLVDFETFEVFLAIPS